MTFEVLTAGRRPEACFATDVVGAGLDPLTDRTLSFNHVPMAAWAGHLCDLLIGGQMVDTDGNARKTDGTPPEHPLVARAWVQLRPSLPRPWNLLFGPQVVDINRVAAETRDWLVEAGVWTRRGTLLGTRYKAVSATRVASIDAATPPTEDRDLRAQVRQALIAIARFGQTEEHPLRSQRPNELNIALERVLATTQSLIASKAGRPLITGPGGMQ